MEQLSYGMIGCGRVSRAHIAAVEDLEGARLIAVADPDQDKARAAISNCAAPPDIHADYRELLADEAVDVVVIATPTHTHRDIAVEAAAAGKHIYCEKAMAHTMRACREMIEARDAHGVKLMIGQSTRFRPQFEMARRVIERGGIGEVFAIDARFTGAGNPPEFGATDSWRYQSASAGNGHIINFGCHYIDTARWLCGRDPVSVTAWIDNFFSRGMIQEDQFSVTARCEGEAVITISLYSPPAEIHSRDDGYFLFATAGFIATQVRSETIVVTHGNDEPEEVVPDEDLIGEGLWTRIHRRFRASILDDTIEPVTGEDAMRNMEWGLAAYLSSAGGCRVDLPLGPEHDDYAGPRLAHSIPATRE